MNTIDLQPGEGKPLNILTNVNRSHMNTYTAVLSLSPSIGIWSPRLSLVLMGQNFEMVHYGQMLKLNNPLLMTNWFNSFSISKGYILTADMIGHTSGDNTIATLKPSFQLNLGITKKFNNGLFNFRQRMSFVQPVTLCLPMVQVCCSINGTIAIRKLLS